MTEALTVLSKIGVVLLLVGAGWLLRRRGILDAQSTGALSRLVVDAAFPALVLIQLPRTVDMETLGAAWPVPVWALVLLAMGWGIGRAIGRDRTSAFLIGLPNWIFLPLLIAEGLYGDVGIRTVLLFNVGAQLALWTLGVSTLTGRSDPGALLRNPGLLASALGLVVAITAPELVREPVAGLSVLVEALDLFGQITVPLSLCVTGAQLAELPPASDLRLPDLGRVLAARLVLVPLVALGLLLLAEAAGWTPTPAVRSMLVITASMPVAISGSVFAQRFAGDVPLAARAVLASTLLSLVTVPLLVWLAP